MSKATLTKETPRDFGTQEAAVTKHIRQLSKRHQAEGTKLSLSDIAASIRKAGFTGLPEDKEDSPDPIRFWVYRILNREKIWFGRPGTTPTWLYGTPESKKPK